MGGSLVLLTSDLFKTAILAATLPPPFKKGRQRVEREEREELGKGTLRLNIEAGEELVQGHKPYVMLECEAYFEACRYNLDILQKITFLNDEAYNPISKFIVNACPNVNLPAYFKDGDCLLQPIVVSHRFLEVEVISDEDEDTWPSSLIRTSLKFDVDQYAAYKMALTSELAIIQGPPGTGKTFIGIQIVRTLLLNMKRVGFRSGSVPKSPILVLCYTNHALDQFLELLLEAQDDLDIVRVGGQSKSEALAEHTLQEHRSKLRSDGRSYRQGGIFFEEKRLLAEISRIQKQICGLKTEIGVLQDIRGLVSFKKMTEVRKVLLYCIPFPLPNVLGNEDECTKWLGITEELISSESFQVGNILKDWFGIADFELEPKSNISSSQNLFYFEEGSPSNCFKIGAEKSKINETIVVNEKTPCVSVKTLTHAKSVKRTKNKHKLKGKQGVKQVDNVEKHEDRAKAIELKYKNKAALLEAIFDCYHQGRLEEVLELNGMLVEQEDEEVKYALRNGSDLSNYTIAQRWGIYFRVVQIITKLGREALAPHEQRLKENRGKLKVAKDKANGKILKGADIIGMTTTGAAKHHVLLEYAKPQIVVIEEAAEILEAHVITSLTQDCKHLILIGDHFQLRPSTNVYQLERNYHMNVSLFERMILNGVKMCTLKTQHRMRPEISDLITGSIYETLHNHQNVLDYPSVKGVAKNLFFLFHAELESQDVELMSKSNQHEAQFIARLCEYLLLQGYKSSEITVLTAYTGQMFLLKKVIPAACRGVHITCVDSYQGEENKIILLSLVRSNSENKIGFVGIENRVCVALSRAKHGMFIIGNLNSFVKVSKIWKQIQEKLEIGENCGSDLELKCLQHEKITKVKCARDFLPLMPGGGCGGRCNADLPKCSHRCPQKCHALDRTHKLFKCKEKCERKCQAGDHDCISKCYAKCPLCLVPMMRKLPCEHEVSLPCYENYLKWACKVLVHKILPCGHEVEAPCHKSPADILCKTEVELELRCGHSKVVACHQVKVKEKELEQKCDELVEKTLVACGHKQLVKCWIPPNSKSIKCLIPFEHTFQPCGHQMLVACWMLKKPKCTAMCEHVFKCGHQCALKCHLDKNPDHLKYKCRMNCNRRCASGEHECNGKHLCHNRKCPPCHSRVQKTFPECGHTLSVACSRRDAQLCPCTLLSKLVHLMKAFKLFKILTIARLQRAAITQG